MCCFVFEDANPQWQSIVILYYSVAEEAHRHDPWYSSLEARVERNAKADDSADVTRSNGEDCEEEYLNFVCTLIMV